MRDAGLTPALRRLPGGRFERRSSRQACKSIAAACVRRLVSAAAPNRAGAGRGRAARHRSCQRRGDALGEAGGDGRSWPCGARLPLTFGRRRDAPRCPTPPMMPVAGLTSLAIIQSQPLRCELRCRVLGRRARSRRRSRPRGGVGCGPGRDKRGQDVGDWAIERQRRARWRPACFLEFVLRRLRRRASRRPRRRTRRRLPAAPPRRPASISARGLDAAHRDARRIRHGDGAADQRHPRAEPG